MKENKKDYIILIIILSVTCLSVLLATVFNKGKNNLQTSMVNEKPRVEITKIVSVATNGLAEDLKSYIKDNLTVVVYPKVTDKYSSVSYTLNVKNLGDNDIELRSINITPKIGEHLLYTISNLQAGDVVESGDSKMFTVEISYNNEYELDSVTYNEEPIYIMLDFQRR